MKFNVGDRVMMIEDNKILKGVIKKDFSEIVPNIVMVEFEDNDVRKVRTDILALEPKTETEEQKKEPEEKSEITITQEEFKNIGCGIVAEIVAKTFNFKLGTKLTAFLALLAKKLFSIPDKND